MMTEVFETIMKITESYKHQQPVSDWKKFKTMSINCQTKVLIQHFRGFFCLLVMLVLITEDYIIRNCFTYDNIYECVLILFILK